MPANYRPVSLTCVTCKLLEHNIFSNTMNFLEEHIILNINQHGFRNGHSCESQLINTIECLARGLDQKSEIDCLVLDISQAFDTVPHQRLLYKISYYHSGISGKANDWIRAWLVGRKQTVLVDGYNARESEVKSGVPQGTVLGLLLFLLYINDINEAVDSHTRLFADDCLLNREVKSSHDSDALQADINRVVEWSHTWQMAFNPSKCTVLKITHTRSPTHHKYTMEGVVLQSVHRQTYLGVELSSNLSWGWGTLAKLLRQLVTL